MGYFLLLKLCLLPIVMASTGTACAACQIVVGLFERLAMKYDCSIKNATQIFCTDLAPKFEGGQKLCDDATALLAPLIEIDYLLHKPPQHTCTSTLKLCSDFPTCNLYTQWPPGSGSLRVASKEDQGDRPAKGPGPWRRFAEEHGLGEELLENVRDFMSFFTLGLGMQGVESMGLVKRMQRFGARSGPVDNIEHHLPADDLDGDRFSPARTLRGSDWRGKDCDDLRKDVYPGRAKTAYSAETDHNCNGIFGSDSTGRAYEEKFCSGTGQLGVIGIGDSATAHFRVPPDWLDADRMDATTYQHAIPLALNELDWPACSSSTAHRNNSECPPTAEGLPVTSVYSKLRQRNLCNHRDFQNLGVNGARSTNTAPPGGDALAMKARNGTDQPALVLYALIGNDVCSGHHDFEHMTSAEEFENKTLATLAYLDAHLANGSHVVFSGLVDGRILFDTMHGLTHPVGTTYADVYEFLNCVNESPCWGWMNSNATVRELTSRHAALLNTVYRKIIASNKFKNFDMFYVDTFSILDEVVAEWTGAGHEARDLIEPTDGFHPSQTANTLLTERLWANLTANFPQAIGAVNPHNAEIVAMFGDQGGY